MRAAKLTLSACLAAGLLAGAALAVQPDEILEDAGLESRACQNQSIDDSEAPLARDLRLLVRERLLAGDDDRAVKDYVVARYGDYVLLKPPIKPTTYLLWGGPAAILLLALLTAVLYFRRRAHEATSHESQAPLSADEQRRLDALLGDDGERR